MTEKNQQNISTKDLLKKAFVDLYLKKPLKKISVNELADTCHISRSTFYLYYTDIYALLSDLEDTFLDGVMTLNVSVILEALKRKPQPESYTVPYANMLKYITDNSKIFRVLMNGSESMRFRKKYLQKIRKNVISMFEIDRKAPESLWNLSCAFHAGGVIALFEAWLDEDFKSDPVEVASIVYKALFIGLLNPLEHN